MADPLVTKRPEPTPLPHAPAAGPAVGAGKSLPAGTTSLEPGKQPGYAGSRAALAAKHGVCRPTNGAPDEVSMRSYLADAVTYSRGYVSLTEQTAKVVDEVLALMATNAKYRPMLGQNRRAIREGLADAGKADPMLALGALAVGLLSLSAGVIGAVVLIESSAALASAAALKVGANVANGGLQLRKAFAGAQATSLEEALAEGVRLVGQYTAAIGTRLTAVTTLLGEIVTDSAETQRSLLVNRLQSLGDGLRLSALCGPDYPPSFVKYVMDECGEVRANMRSGGATAERAAATAAAGHAVGAWNMAPGADTRSVFDTMYDMGRAGELDEVELEVVETREVELVGYRPLPSVRVDEQRHGYHVLVQSRRRKRRARLLAPGLVDERLTKLFPEWRVTAQPDAIPPEKPYDFQMHVNRTRRDALACLPDSVLHKRREHRLEITVGRDVVAHEASAARLDSKWWDSEALASAMAEGPRPFVHDSIGAIVGVFDITTGMVREPEWLDDSE